MAANTKPASPLAKAARSRLGRLCWFTHPETGEVVEGFYKQGRKIVRTVGMRRMTTEELRETNNGEPAGASGYMVDEQTFTVPHHVRIHLGPAPVAHGSPAPEVAAK